MHGSDWQTVRPETLGFLGRSWGRGPQSGRKASTQAPRILPHFTFICLSSVKHGGLLSCNHRNVVLVSALLSGNSPFPSQNGK